MYPSLSRVLGYKSEKKTLPEKISSLFLKTTVVSSNDSQNAMVKVSQRVLSISVFRLWIKNKQDSFIKMKSGKKYLF